MKFLNCGKTPLGLYPLVDRADKLEILYSLGVTTAQLRIKHLDGNRLEKEIVEAITISNRYNTRLFINDYWELAIKHKAYGIHLGQEDLQEADLEKIHRANIRLGVSTHTTKEIELALNIHPSYLAIGPIFETSSKEVNYSTVGIKELKKWAENLNYPVVAIGGINLKNIHDILSISNISGIAMISELIEQKKISINKTKQLLNLFQKK